MNLRAFLLMTSCLTAVIASVAHADKVYRWVDSEGKVHYSSTPPAGTSVRAQKVNVTAPQVLNVVAPAQPLPQRSMPHADNSLDKAKADATDKQIRVTWRKFTKALGECQGIGQQLDDLRNGVSPNPVTHTALTDAERAARERMLEAQLKSDCPEDGG